MNNPWNEFRSKQFPIHREVVCAACGTAISSGSFHTGFSDMDVLYCSQCERALLLSRWDAFLGPEHNEIPRFQEHNRHYLSKWKQIEELLKPCPCGGRFAFLNSPRCPLCHGLLCGDMYEDKPILKEVDRYPIICGPTANAAMWRLDASA
ncbi:MAG TPA: hypothetical protein VG897_02570 [Terriglobales bacterium]|nr:hypothetical protein [Terriglobales bacterium]